MTRYVDCGGRSFNILRDRIHEYLSLSMSPSQRPAPPPGPEVASCLAMSTLNFVVYVYQLPCQHNQSVDHSVDILCEFLTL